MHKCIACRKALFQFLGLFVLPQKIVRSSDEQGTEEEEGGEAEFMESEVLDTRDYREEEEGEDLGEIEGAAEQRHLQCQEIIRRSGD